MGTLKTTNIQTITGSGTLTLGTSGETLTVPTGVTVGGGISNTPAFEVYKSSDQDVTDNATVKVTWDVEDIDTDSAFDLTNNKFVVPTGMAGKYYIYSNLLGRSTTSKQVQDMRTMIYKNGSNTKTGFQIFSANIGDYISSFANATMDLADGDEIEIYNYINIGSGTPRVTGSSDRRSWFGGYRLIGS